MQCRLTQTIVRGFGGKKIAFDLAELGVAVEYVVERAHIQRGDFLAHIGHGPIARPLEMTGVGSQFAGDQREQAGFAGAVAPADTPTRQPAVQGQIDMCSSKRSGPRRSARSSKRSMWPF